MSGFISETARRWCACVVLVLCVTLAMSSRQQMKEQSPFPASTPEEKSFGSDYSPTKKQETEEKKSRQTDCKW